MFGHPFRHNSFMTDILKGRELECNKRAKSKKAFIDKITKQVDRNRRVDMKRLAINGEEWRTRFLNDEAKPLVEEEISRSSTFLLEEEIFYSVELSRYLPIVNVYNINQATIISICFFYRMVNKN